MIAKKLLNNIQKRGVYTINQNEYVGQTPVSIVNNTISLETNFVNKVNSIDNLQNDIQANTNSINTINTTLNGIPEQLTTITNNVSTNTQNIQTNTTNIATNTQQIEAVKTKAETNETNIATINTTLPNKLDTATFDSEKTNFAKTNEANTFVGKNTFKNTGDIVSIQRTDNSSFGIDFKKENGDRVAFVGTSSSEVDKATMWGVSGLKLQTTNSDIKMISGTGDCKWESNKTWNQYQDNTLLRQKDTKWVRIFEKISGINQPNTNWNWNWINGTYNGLVSQEGEIELMIVISWNDNNVNTLTTKLVWKNGIPTSKSNIFLVEKSERTYRFQIEIRQNNSLYIYSKHDNNGTGGTISWVRGYVKRGLGQPTKFEQLW